jgi:ribosomal protein L11 methyltransferase
LHWIAAKVVFDSRDPALTAELIADLFDTVGISGVVVDDPHLEPAEGWGSNAVPLPAQTAADRVPSR